MSTERETNRELRLLDPMPYRLIVNGVIRVRGTLQEMQAGVMDVVTTRLAIAPEQLAAGAQEIRAAFAEDKVAQAVETIGSWYTIFDVESDNPLHITVEPETEE